MVSAASVYGGGMLRVLPLVSLQAILRWLQDQVAMWMEADTGACETMPLQVLEDTLTRVFH